MDLTPAGKLQYKAIEEGKEVYNNLMEMSKNPMKYNEELLFQILNDNKDTEYGKKYDFANINSIEEYQKKVPISTYDDYASYIYRMTEKGEKNLICAYDIIHYNKSSGTMGNPKRIPLSDRGAKINNDYAMAYRCALIANELGMDWINGIVLNLIEVSFSNLKCGASYGAVSGKMITDLSDMLHLFFTSPIEALIPDVETNSRYLHARFALANKEIGNATCSFHNLFLDMLRYIEGNWELLVKDIEKGTIDDSIKMPLEIREEILSKIKPMPERAEELREIFSTESKKSLISRLWPNLKVLTGIGTGGFSSYYSKIRNEFGGDDLNYYLVGLTSSEATFSVPYELNNPEAMLIPNSVFYEFLPLDAGDDFDKIVTMDKLEVGKKYEIIVTNLSGFYRYRMRDAIEVIGMKNNTPLIRFLYRIDQSISFAGESTSEEALRNAAYKTEEDYGFDLVEFSVYTDSEKVPKCVYLMEIDNVPEDFDKEKITESLINNVMDSLTAGSDEFTNTSSKAASDYGHKIKSGVLNNFELKFLQPETYLLYRDLMISKGASSAQLKPPRVIMNDVHKRFFLALLDDELN